MMKLFVSIVQNAAASVTPLLQAFSEAGGENQPVLCSPRTNEAFVHTLTWKRRQEQKKDPSDGVQPLTVSD